MTKPLIACGCLLLLACSDATPPDPDDTSPPSEDTDPADRDTSETDAPTADSDVPAPEPAPCPTDADSAVLTTHGCVLGATLSRTEAFLGIPYAEPPVGQRRFAPPEPAPVWEQPLDASEAGPLCLQFTDSVTTGGPREGDGAEDCLTLNLFRPQGTTAADRLPVLFFVHGGGHVSGGGSLSTYANDPGLAQAAIVVTHNYRLGPLGWLAHADLSAESPQSTSGNLGLRDTLLALRWVHSNAAAFGGDPNQILLFGESAGGLSSCALWASPDADGLYEAVLTQSAACTAVRKPLRGGSLLQESGEAQGDRWVEATGCHTASDVPACLRALSTEAILDALPTRLGFLGSGERWEPVVDGALIPRSFADALTGDHLPDVPFFATVNADEGTIFAQGASFATDNAYRTALTVHALGFGVDGDTLVSTWSPDDFGSRETAYAAFLGDRYFVCPTRALLHEVDAAGLTARGLFYAYPLAPVPTLGAFHGVELPYVFGTVNLLLPGANLTLTSAMQASWQSAPTANPTFDAAPWPTIGTAWAEVAADASLSTVAEVPAGARCDVLFGD